MKSIFKIVEARALLAGVAVLVLVASVFLYAPVNAQEKIGIDFFYSPTCPHCVQEKTFLQELKEQYPEIELTQNNLFEEESGELLESYYDKYQVPVEKRGLVPVTFVGDRYWLGFDDSLGQVIEQHVLMLERGASSEPEIISGEASKASVDAGEGISLPIIGEINITEMNLFAFSALIGALDGFNACAMWALFFLLTFLVASGSRKRVFLIGGTFIFVSGLVYFLLITAWLNLFLLIGYLKIIQIIISLLAVVFGLVCVKDYFAFGEGLSFIIPKVVRDRIVARMKMLSGPNLTLPATIVGVALLAAGVNLIEVICTTGFPVVFTNVLSTHQLPGSSYYFYLMIYILFYMLDDFAIFSVVVLTLGAKPLPDKYKRISKLVSGVVLVLLGLVMLLRPGLLMFG
jgi:glutaredoxin